MIIQQSPHLFESTQSELLEKHLKEISLSGAMLEDAAGSQGNMISEVEGGDASAEEWWAVDESEKQKYSFKKPRKNFVYKPILFSTPYITKWNSNTEAPTLDFAC